MFDLFLIGLPFGALFYTVIFWRECEKSTLFVRDGLDATYRALSLGDESYRRLYREIVVPLAQRAKINSPAFAITSRGGLYQAESCAVPLDKNRSYITVTKEIIHDFTEDELRGVIAHEISHIAQNDSLKQALLVSMRNSFPYLYSVFFFFSLLSLIREGEDALAQAFSFGAVLTVFAYMMSHLFYLWYRRKSELKADLGVIFLTDMPEALISGLKKVHENHLQISMRKYTEDSSSEKLLHRGVLQWIGELMFLTHPKIEKRITHFEDMLERHKRQAGA